MLTKAATSFMVFKPRTSAFTCLKFAQLHSNGYVNKIRRQHQLRENDQLCLETLERPTSRFLVYHKGQPLLKADDYEPVFVGFKEINSHIENLHEKAVLLNLDEKDTATFAVHISNDISHKLEGQFTNLRLAMLFAKEPMLSQGFSLLKWQRDAKFCSKCGGKLNKNAAGCRRTCQACGTVFYPPTSPVGISLVSSPDHSHVLLQRQPMYPKGMYSCIAGFVDVGETLYGCLKREVAEEGGVEIKKPYEVITSQHWPFPNGSFMIGCMVYADTDQQPSKDDHDEIEDAKWFSAADVKSALDFIDTNPKMRVEGSKDGSLFVPPKGTIANQMLTFWIEKFNKE